MRLFSILTCMVTLWLLSGCALFDAIFEGEEDRQSLELDFGHLLPAGWEPVGNWREINIDGDTPVEYLLLYRYDNGQVGAVVYDSQNPSELVRVTGEEGAKPAGTRTPASPVGGVEVVPLLAPASGYFRPYALLPNYWANVYGSEMGQGFIAAPNEADSITVHTLQRTMAIPLLPQPDTSAATPTPTGMDRALPELLLRGGNTHLTFVWWKDRIEGYGVTQLYAPAGFRGINWREWQQSPQPITQISGFYPLVDYRARSLICRQTLYRRTLPETLPGTPVPAQPPILFNAQDQGLAFCEATIPDHPFYPEGVALAFWLAALPENAANSDVTHLMSPGVSIAQVDADIAQVRFDPNLRLNDIQTYPLLSVAEDVSAEGFARPTTTVCIELATQAEKPELQWVVLTLRHQPADVEQRLPDRWTISGAALEPPPISPPQSDYCRTILQRSAPQTAP